MSRRRRRRRGGGGGGGSVVVVVVVLFPIVVLLLLLPLLSLSPRSSLSLLLHNKMSLLIAVFFNEAAEKGSLLF